MAVLRLWAVGAAGLGDDEAYYWLWSKRLALGYFDHPGGIAWLIRGCTEVVGSHPLGTRLPVVVAGFLLAWMLGESVEPEHRPAAILLGLLVPVFGLLGVFASPDMPFLVAWFVTVRCAEGLLRGATRAHWLMLGSGLGATMLFKITGVLLGAGLLVWSLVDRDRRRWWATSGPWWALASAVVVSAPTWGWNAAHGFPTLWFHAVERHSHAVSPLAGGAVWLAVHVLLLTPPLMWAVLAARATPRGRMLMWIAAPTWLVFTAAAFVAPTKLHWWAPAWLTVLPAAIPILNRHRRWMNATLLVSGGLHVSVLALAAYPPLPLAGLTAQLRGWDGLVERLVADHPDAVAWTTNRYQAAAQLAFAARDRAHPPIRRVGGREDQFTVWHADSMPTDGPILVVCAPHLPCTTGDFEGLVCDAEITAPVLLLEGRSQRDFQVWRCSSLP